MKYENNEEVDLEKFFLKFILGGNSPEFSIDEESEEEEREAFAQKFTDWLEMKENLAWQEHQNQIEALATVVSKLVSVLEKKDIIEVTPEDEMILPKS